MVFYQKLLSLFGVTNLSIPPSWNTHGSTNITQDLLAKLSPNASVTTDLSFAPRWSDYHSPRGSKYVVLVAEEQDVVETVKFANENDLNFFAQAGGHGWTSFDWGKNDIIINLRGLNQAVVNEAKDEILLGGGTLQGEALAEAAANDVFVVAGGFNCVSALGVALGGGLGRWINRYGIHADNIIKVNLVTAEGELIEVSENSHPDLLWAIRGAGPNFGIVTSATMQAHPILNKGQLWEGELTFAADKLEKYIEAINTMNYTEDMTNHWRFALNEHGTPVIVANVFFMSGDVEAARAGFKILYDLEPIADTTEVKQYAHINDGRDALCAHGGRKPAWSVGLKSLDYPSFKTILDEFVKFVADTGIMTTIMQIECYHNDAMRRIGSEGASYPFRDINFYALIIPVYDDASLDPVVETFGSRVNDLWKRSSGYEKQRTYINFAHGDEPLEQVYGDSLCRLSQLKGKWDPLGRFNQWFPIPVPVNEL
ncbi:FAD-binding domain-containing protein [Cucurbitaria berberidis CBS 394.84]|uniref:FAD-binding domain-containing protein n=1 Tax=Cucurbitaria berberidis CBS 394.84 TaxID=1168544 RepID=A0A9P4GJ42_9PLEO|nr:FAD-binding domain-containing protein [Cucurbitaria berberidis CBS 394.84]KAF1846587.1 FAD-binding domain-containing protein [Cucurbitaria berberidis CBS 394.84]